MLIVRRTIAILLVILGFGVVFSDQAIAQSNKYCRPHWDQKYTGVIQGGYHEIIPSIAFNDYLIDFATWPYVIPFSPDQKNVEICGSGGTEVVPGAYAISNNVLAPWLIGSPCAAQPKVGIRARGLYLKIYAQSVLTEKPMDPAMMQLLYETADVSNRKGMTAGLDFQRANNVDEFARMVYLILNLINTQCGSPPGSIEFIVYMGTTSDMLYSSPEVMTIKGTFRDDAYNFDFENLGMAKLMDMDARRISEENFAKTDEWLRKRQAEREARFSEWQTPEGRFALGALIVGGILGGIALNSPCWDDPNNFAC